MGRPRGTAGARTRAAGAAAARTLPNDRRVGEPCATCPKPPGPDTEFDGALMGAGCKALTDPRAKGQLKPRQVVDRVIPGQTDGMGGYAPPVTLYKDDPRDAGRARQRVTREETNVARGRAVVPTSKCCAAQQAKAGRRGDDWGGRTIIYVNGINTTRAAHCTTLRAIANSTCARVIGVYNATDGMSKDLWQVRQDRALIEDAAAGRPFAVGDRRNPAVDTMADLVTNEAVAGRHVELWAHSQGGAIASLSLYDVKRRLGVRGFEAPLRNTEVDSFAAAAPNWPDGADYTHYIHTGDFVPVYTGLGHGPYTPTMTGHGADVIRFADAAPDEGRRYAWDDTEVPAPNRAELHAIVPNQWARPVANHSMDDTYLPLYRQRRSELREPVCPGSEH